MAPTTVQNDVVVSIAYKMTVDGVEMDEMTTDDPLEYLHGAENVIPGLEKALTGKKVGDKLSIDLQPEEAYGEYDDEDIDEVDLRDIPNGKDLKAGMELLLEDEDGYMFEATVKSINAKTVLLDFNDPLAGKVVHYDVEVVGLRDADEEELENGHPHSLFEDEDWEYEDEQ